ncbi:Uncharacterised protein [Segatella copri]|nr:Uncharacterised protein [Segatella copri]
MLHCPYQRRQSFSSTSWYRQTIKTNFSICHFNTLLLDLISYSIYIRIICFSFQILQFIFE